MIEKHKAEIRKLNDEMNTKTRTTAGEAAKLKGEAQKRISELEAMISELTKRMEEETKKSEKQIELLTADLKSANDNV